MVGILTLKALANFSPGFALKPWVQEWSFVLVATLKELRRFQRLFRNLRLKLAPTIITSKCSMLSTRLLWIVLKLSKKAIHEITRNDTKDVACGAGGT
jgi:hypothetical protein